MRVITRSLGLILPAWTYPSMTKRSILSGWRLATTYAVSCAVAGTLLRWPSTSCERGGVQGVVDPQHFDELGGVLHRLGLSYSLELYQGDDALVREMHV